MLNSSSSMGFPNLLHRFSNPEPLLGTPISRLGTSCLRFPPPNLFHGVPDQTFNSTVDLDIINIRKLKKNKRKLKLTVQIVWVLINVWKKVWKLVRADYFQILLLRSDRSRGQGPVHEQRTRDFRWKLNFAVCSYIRILTQSRVLYERL